MQIGSRFLTLDQSNQAGVMYHSLSNLLGFRLRAYQPYVYTGFIMRYLAVGKSLKLQMVLAFPTTNLFLKNIYVQCSTRRAEKQVIKVYHLFA